MRERYADEKWRVYECRTQAPTMTYPHGARVCNVDFGQMAHVRNSFKNRERFLFLTCFQYVEVLVRLMCCYLGKLALLAVVLLLLVLPCREVALRHGCTHYQTDRNYDDALFWV